jgi:soluble lytic murein transglycosylase
MILAFFLVGATFSAQGVIEPRVFDLMKEKKWQQSYELASKGNNQVLKKIVLSQQFLDPHYSNNSFEKITKFLIQNPYWPQKFSIQVSAENFLNQNTDQAAIIRWFRHNRPLTKKGHKYYALAAAKLEKDPVKLSALVKSGWHNGNFSIAEQKSYYKRFRSYLNTIDHIKKLDNHLLNSEITAAKNSYYLVNREYRKSFDAQIALIQKKPEALKLFKAINRKYYTPGLIYRYIEAKKRSLPSSLEIVKLINMVKIHSEYADRIWKLQNYIAREYIEKKRYVDAYKVASCHFAGTPANKSEAEFLSGWLALRFLNKPKQAVRHFINFNKVVKTPISKSRGLYWLARSYEILKEQEKAQKLYYSAASKYPYTFYGQMAAVEIGVKKIILAEDVDFKKHKINSKPNPATSQVIKAATIVSKFGSNSLAQIYIKSAVEQTKNSTHIMNLAANIIHFANVHHMAWLTKYALQKHFLIKNHAYPTPYQIDKSLLEASLVYSIIRQESVFDQYAVSRANAKGLMQVLETTACDVARDIGDKCITSKLTSNAFYNVKLGSNYLHQLVELFNGSYILAIASYNGGPHNVDKWLAIYGDPREMRHHRSVLDWLELIPFYETRNYVQRVLENLQIYRSILQPGSLLALKRDLTLKQKNGAK